ncbi:helix-turn-helix domain-containing protein [Aquibacillus saliphilus]|uniref:helix-turn-helix domain-containing protein n=1 Tax=Aquibacillus saliphilus TaxID=1909422 RepID=UPI001CF0783C|nr:RodZ domain-containing protein [Aquibacillus saliphilus]
MEIGERLKEARELKQLSLDDIQKVTKIQKRYLQAIEKSNFSVMPGNFYVRAFIKEYATAVELDPEQLIEEHQDELPSTSDESSIQYTRVQRSRKDTTPAKSPAIFSFLPTAIVVLLIVGIVFAVWYFNKESQADDSNEPVQTEDIGNDEVRLPPDEAENDDSGSNGDEETSTNDNEESEEETTQDEPEPTLTLVDQGNGEQTYDLENATDELLLTLKSDSEHWLEIKNGEGASFYEDMFYADQTPYELDLTGEERIYLRFGNPRELDITINGVSLELPDDIEPTTPQNVWINVQNSAE